MTDFPAHLIDALPAATGAKLNGHAPDPVGESPLGDTVAAFQKWLHLPDPSALLFVLGVVAANRLGGDPVWGLLVGPPGGGKSEILQSVGKLPDIHGTATLTEAALLSGTPKRDSATDAKGGLLREIGEFGIVLAKDFGSVLSMNRDARSLLLAALREVYDGSWTRHVGTDGGRKLHWEGKVGLVGGCTPTIDRHHAVMGSMGERFLLFRLPPSDEDAQADLALAHAGREVQMRAELTGAVTALFDVVLPADLTPELEPLDEPDRVRLRKLATLVVRCRSAVERDGYSREVELVPEPEAPTRLIVVLRQLLHGLAVIGVDDATAWAVVTKAALDCMPALRRKVLEHLHGELGLVPTSEIAEAVAHPTATTLRALEDLHAHHIVRRDSHSNMHKWELTPRARDRYEAVTRQPLHLAEGGEQ